MTATAFPRNVVANDEATAISNLVPGAEMLGYGFNIFKTYSFNSAIQPLLKLGAPVSWTSGDGKTFNVPENVQTPGGSNSSASATSFETASEFNSYFQSSASVSGSVGAFSSSFSTSFSSEQRNAQSHSWALVEADFHAWTVHLQNRVLIEGIAADEDWKNLPDHFNPRDESNVLAFFRFFQRFGTHFISRVSAGGTLYYYFAVQRSSSYSSREIEQNAMAEYQGLICSTKVEASRKWGSVSQNWTQNRQARAHAEPMTTAVVDWVNPQAGSYDEGGQFAAWKQSVTQSPTRTTFGLTPIWDLFSGAKWTALQLAYQSYANTRISVSASRFQDDTIMINGTSMYTPDPRGKFGSWQIVVLDSKSLKPVLNRTYSFQPGPLWPDDTYSVMIRDLKPYSGNDAYMLVAATSQGDMGESPNTEFYGILRSFGAGNALDRWYNNGYHACGLNNNSAAYALVGKGGAATGCENFVTITDPNPPLGVTINAFLLPLSGSFYPQEYQS
jgi:hypothetical protein